MKRNVPEFEIQQGKRHGRSNVEIIAGLQNGDEECATLFFERFGHRIDRLVRRLLGVDKAHDDVVQMVYLNLLKSLGNIRDAERFEQWVDSVTFRTVYKEIRNRKYSRRVVPSSDRLPEQWDQRNPERYWLARRFHKAFEKLEAEERMMLALKFFENRTLAEMAEVSGWSMATVKRRIRAAVIAFEEIAARDKVLASYVGEK